MKKIIFMVIAVIAISVSMTSCDKKVKSQTPVSDSTIVDTTQVDSLVTDSVAVDTIQ